MNTLTTEQALSIIDQALNLSLKSGAFTLKDAEVLSSAFTVIKEHVAYHTPKSDEIISE